MTLLIKVRATQVGFKIVKITKTKLKKAFEQLSGIPQHHCESVKSKNIPFMILKKPITEAFQH